MTDADAFQRRTDDGFGAPADRATVLEVLGRTELRGSSVGIVHLDIDRFHRVNARFGQVVGDSVLGVVRDRLTEEIGGDGIVVAADGDAFVAVLPSSDAERTRIAAARLLDAVRRPIPIGQDVVTVNASAGTASCTRDGRPIDLVEQAFLACRHAKATAPGTVVGYEVAFGTEAERRQRFEDDLRRAIAFDELVLHVQPEIRSDGEVIGVEALVRWQHPTDGLLSPMAFIPDAVTTGLMVELGDWVLDQAIALAGRWRTMRDGDPLRVWVNLAAQQLEHGPRLLERMRRALEDGSVGPDCIGFEVTESSLLEDLPAAVELLGSLRSLGFEISLDDFGTGYSSLTYLRQLPVSAVKIDRQFVAGIRDGSLADEAIVEAVIDLSHALGLTVVAEGVEDALHAAQLIALGADSMQGYHFSRPEAPEVIERLVTQRWCGVGPPVPAGADLRPLRGAHPTAATARSRLFFSVLDAATDSVVVTAHDERGGLEQPIVYVNDAFRSETGFDPADVLGRPVGDLFANADDPALRTFFARLPAEQPRPVIEVASRRADGSVFLAEITVSPIVDERGFHTHSLHVRRDLSQRRAAEGERAPLQALMEQTDALVYVTEAGGRWLYANGALRRAIGVPLDVPTEELTSVSALPPELRPVIEQSVSPALAERGSWSGELTFRDARTGEIVDIVADVQVLDDPLRPGTKVHAVVGRDITTTKHLLRAHERRRELDDFTASFARSALNERPAVFLDRLSGRLRDLGELMDADLVFLDTIDHEAGVLRPLSAWRVGAEGSARPDRPVPLSSVASWIAHLTANYVEVDGCVGESMPWQRELADVFPCAPDGRKLRASLQVDGELLGVLGVASAPGRAPWSDDEVATVRALADTVANQLVRRHAELALDARDEWYTRLLRELQDLLVVLDRDGVVRYVNPAVEVHFGHRRDLVIGRDFLDLIHPDDRALAVRRFTTSGLVGDPLDLTELRILRADGSPVWCDVDSTGRYDRVIGGFTVALRDISEQRAAMEAAQRGTDIDQFVASLARWASEVRGDDFVDGLSVHLERLARLLDADHAFVATIDGDRVRNVGGWTRRGDPAAYAFPSDDAAVPAVIERYRTLEPLVVDDILNHDEPWAVEWRAFPVPDRAGLNVPLVAEGCCFGNIGIAMAESPRPWTTQEVLAVSRAAHIVANLLARRQVEASLRLSEERLRALLDSSQDILAVVDDARTITYANQAFVRALGYSIDEIVGMPLEQILHPEDRPEALRRVALLHRGGTVGATTVRLLGKDGSAEHWEVTSGRMRDPLQGGRVYTCRNVSARAAAERRSAMWIDMLRGAFDLAQSALDLDSSAFLERLPAACARVGAQLGATLVYIDRVDVAARRLVNVAAWPINADQQKLPEGESVEFDGLPEWIERLREPEPVVITGDERQPLAYVQQKAAVLGGGHPEVAVSMTAAGELFGVLGACREPGQPFSPDEVAYVRLIGETIAHVLERARLDEALRASESRFRLLSENAADVVMLVARKGTITYASPSVEDLLGHSAAELTGKSVRSLAHPDGIAEYALQYERVLASGRSGGEVRLVRADGREVWVDTSTSAVSDPQTGRVSEYRISMRDVTDRKRLEQQLEWQALHDPLTNLANRVLLRRQLDLAAARRGRPNDVTVLLVDLDRFKEVNDTHGHAFGDEVLRVLAARFESLGRPTDTLARTGGDEFVLLCPETDAAGGVALAQRVVDAARAPVDVAGVTVTVGASVGVAHQSGDLDASALLLDADRAMYEAKRSGSGEVRVAPSRAMR